MSEYIEVEYEESDDGSQLYVYTNLRLAEGGVERYRNREEMAEGSPVAQALAVVEGIAALRIEEQDLVITPDAETAVHAIAADVSAVLKDFFL